MYLTPPTHGQRIGAFGADLSFDKLPADVVEKAKVHLLDAIAVAYAFARDDLAERLVGLLTASDSAPRNTIIGFSERASTRNAAMINGSLAHGKDFDDVHVRSITHPSAIVTPVVLALGEAGRLDGGTVIAAMTLGIEVMTRLGISGGTAMAGRGIPPMTVCGTMGAAASAARALKLDAQGIAAAVGVAGSMACGSHEWTIAGTNSKLTTCGWAARSAVLAAQMAQGGFNGSLSAIEGRKGLLVAMAGPDLYDPDAPSADLGERWEIRNLEIKLHASCQGTQPYIDAAIALRNRHGIDPAAIEHVDIKIGAGVGMSLSEPFEMKRNPPNAYAAKFSIPFCVARALQVGSVSLSDFESGWDEARSAASLAMNVRHVVDTDFDIGAADRGFVRIKLKDGRTFETESRTSERRLTIGDVETKLADCADWLLDRGEQRRLIDAFLDLDRAPDVAPLVAMLGRPRGR